MRKKLKYLRVVEYNLTQSEMAAKIGVSRSIYSQVENGTLGISPRFLTKLQTAFSIPDSEVWSYTKNETEV